MTKIYLDINDEGYLYYRRKVQTVSGIRTLLGRVEIDSEAKVHRAACKEVAHEVKNVRWTNPQGPASIAREVQ